MVNPFKTRLAFVADLLNKSGVEYVVIGAEAGQIHGVVRATRDVDILLKKTPENVSNALSALSNLSWGIAKEMSVEEVLSKPITIIGDQPAVDLLFVAGKLKYDVAIRNVEFFQVEGIRVPVAGIDDLILSKDTDRAKDASDVEVLRSIKRKR